MKRKMLWFAVQAIFAGAVSNSYAEGDCGNSHSDKKVSNFLCKSCNVNDADLTAESQNFVRNEVNSIIHESLNQNLNNPGSNRTWSGWKNGQTIILTNGKEWRTWQFNPFRGSKAFMPTSAGGTGTGPGNSINHDGAGNACPKKDAEPTPPKTVGGGGSSGGSRPSSPSNTSQPSTPDIQSTTRTTTYVASCDGCKSGYRDVTTTRYYVNGSYAGSSSRTSGSYSRGGGGGNGGQPA